jgi:dTDP-4-amino-4,6-dideoxygalactose transaminase
MAISRGDFIARMKEREIGVGVHYPAMHLFNVYRQIGYGEGDFPHAEAVGSSIVSLPLFPAMTLQDVSRVCTTISAVFKESQR